MVESNFKIYARVDELDKDINIDGTDTKPQRAITRNRLERLKMHTLKLLNKLSKIRVFSVGRNETNPLVPEQTVSPVFRY